MKKNSDFVQSLANNFAVYNELVGEQCLKLNEEILHIQQKYETEIQHLMNRRELHLKQLEKKHSQNLMQVENKYKYEAEEQNSNLMELQTVLQEQQTVHKRYKMECNLKIDEYEKEMKILNSMKREFKHMTIEYQHLVSNNNTNKNSRELAYWGTSTESDIGEWKYKEK